MRKLILSIIFLMFCQLAHADITTGLIGWWKMDEGSGTSAFDSSQNGNTGTLTNSPTWTTGKINGALTFSPSGSGNWVDAGDINAFDSLTSMSVCSWVYPTNNTIDGGIVNKTYDSSTDGFLLFLDTSGVGGSKLYSFFIADSASTANTRIESAANSAVTGAWTHICGTFTAGSSTGLRMYINGSEVAGSPVSTTSISGIDAGPRHFYIGSRDLGITPFTGNIDEVRVYNRVLSSSDVTELYNETSQNYGTTVATIAGSTSRVTCSGPFTAPENGSISDIYWYSSGSGANWRGAIYDSDGTSSRPGTLLSQATSDTSLSSSNGWSKSTLSTPFSMVSGHDYHLCAFSDTPSTPYYYASDASYNVWFSSTQYTSYSTFPTTWGNNTTASSRKMGIYALYSPGASSSGGGSGSGSTLFFGDTF